MEKIILQATKRDVIGKKVKNLRLAGKLPAVMYGHNFEPTPIVLDTHKTVLTLKKISESTIVNIDLDGKEYAALIRDRHIDFLKNELLHLDFQVVSLTEKIRTDVHIELSGEAPAVSVFNAMIVNGITEVEVEALPRDLPERITVDISGLDEIGKAVYVKDIPAIDKVTILTDPEELIAIASAVKEEIIEEPVVEEAEGEAAPLTEPEVIEHGKREEEVEE
ncbi:MAG TPA: 50S ribosomal protein L25 [Anaerolineaceae bacterium]|jgi:large subunit ribosomal protein L25|nr:50S ribosomal protein L25 [Anaerolineaceae bacterium]